jgi:hypothetical protein
MLLLQINEDPLQSVKEEEKRSLRNDESNNKHGSQSVATTVSFIAGNLRNLFLLCGEGIMLQNMEHVFGWIIYNR